MRSIYVKTVQFEAVQFSMSSKLSSIRTIERTLSGATTAGYKGPGVMAIKGFSASPQTPVLLEPRHQIVYCHIQDTFFLVRV